MKRTYCITYCFAITVVLVLNYIQLTLELYNKKNARIISLFYSPIPHFPFIICRYFLFRNLFSDSSKNFVFISFTYQLYFIIVSLITHMNKHFTFLLYGFFPSSSFSPMLKYKFSYKQNIRE